MKIKPYHPKNVLGHSCVAYHKITFSHFTKKAVECLLIQRQFSFKVKTSMITSHKAKVTYIW